MKLNYQNEFKYSLLISQCVHNLLLQGFCCVCRGQSDKTKLIRSNIFCASRPYHLDKNGTKFAASFSAHCLNFSKLWYDVYDIGFPQFLYDIRVILKENRLKKVNITEDGVTEILMARVWTTVSDFILSPARPGGRSKDGRVSQCSVNHAPPPPPQKKKKKNFF